MNFEENYETKLIFCKDQLVLSVFNKSSLACTGQFVQANWTKSMTNYAKS
jgi:hypothetical protein